MKRQVGFLTVMVVMFVAVLGYSGAQHVKDWTGSETVDMGSVVFNNGTLNKIYIADPERDVMWDRLIGAMKVYDIIGAGDTAIGNTDSAFVTLIAGKGSRLDTLQVDTVFPGDSGTINYDFYRGKVLIIDSADGHDMEDIPDTTWTSLGLDHLWFTWHVADSAADTTATATMQIQWWFRLVEED